jgi:hypothetical protein
MVLLDKDKTSKNTDRMASKKTNGASGEKEETNVFVYIS